MARNGAVEPAAEELGLADLIEERLLHAWRRDQLRRLGVPGHLADVYADAVDWHDAEALIGVGCDPVTALDILR